MPPPDDVTRSHPLYIMSLGVHGLVRGTNIELGRDVDTGGQTSYMVDQAKALGRRPEIGRVDLVTRLIDEQRIDESYARPFEELEGDVQIVRIPFGPRRYLRKERLWPYLDGMRDQLIRFIRSIRRAPDVVHGHYADAGYLGAQVAAVLGVPFVFTGHSLGRVKRARLLADGADPEILQERYHIAQRIEAEERALERAALVITSTHQEIEEQYLLYDHYQPERMAVIPPGVDLSRFSPPAPEWADPPVARQLARFLEHPDKPIILAIARPDHRKNFPALLRAYSEHEHLRAVANLVIVAGTRDDMAEMPAAARRVLNEILYLVDRYDLYGSVAYPKDASGPDIADLYRLAARSRGVFVNPALTEPFGLTLIEAAASGLPIVATNDGGPKEIIDRCNNGLLVDPLNDASIAAGLHTVLTADAKWQQWSDSGLAAAHRAFSWNGHAVDYVTRITEILRDAGPEQGVRVTQSSRLPQIDRLLVSDVDNTLTGDNDALDALKGKIEQAGPGVGFAIATGRTLDHALEIIQELQLAPDILISSSGTELHYLHGELAPDFSWAQQIKHNWEPDKIRETMREFPGLSLRHEPETVFRVSFDVGPDGATPPLPAVRRTLRKAGLRVGIIMDHGVHLEVIPIRSGPGHAIRFLCYKWDLPPERILVAGDSGNDAEMLSGDTLGVVVGNYSPELEHLKGQPRVYFASREHAWGVLEGINHYDFFGSIRVTDEDGP